MTETIQAITGSYEPGDVSFLLRPAEIGFTDVAEKERLIQSGRAHYSEMISEERRPDARYMEIYERALSASAGRIASEVAALADAIEADFAGREIVLCSLVRAGVPYGVCLQREFRRRGRTSVHYGVSIVRDRGLDKAAMGEILSRHRARDILFVDGWTGKGAIRRELDRSWPEISGHAPRLAVLADPCGRAEFCGSREDWLIPSGILGANVSGLVSRSILDGPAMRGARHGYMPVDMADIDVSLDFVARVGDAPRGTVPAPANPDMCRMRSEECVLGIAARMRISNLNRIKPGLAEATRAVLRRQPREVLMRDTHPDTDALRHLCMQGGIRVREGADIWPYRAITIIERTS